MHLFNEIAKRGVALLLLAATAFATITYSLGLYEISFIDRGEDEYDDNSIQEILGTLAPGTNISEFTGDITDITEPPATSLPQAGTSAPDSSDSEAATSPGTSAPGTTGGSDIPVPPSGPNTLAEFLAAGYKITWENYDPNTQLAEITLDAEGLDQYTLGSYKRVRVKMKMNYG